ncbi:MAG: hypothetical protein M3Z26_17545 [Bacteroidota bacterium]|nr:hypothetical protein [Bacteroidota bacterium]
MKKLISLTFLFCVTFSSYSQDVKDSTQSAVTKADSTELTKDTSNLSKATDSTTTSIDNDFGWKDKFAFIVGGGFSTNGTTLYNDPVINKTNNAVIIESSQKLRTSLTLGIVFTPKIFNVKRVVLVPTDKKGKVIESDTLIEYVPRKWSFAMFLNPISLTKLNDNSFTNTVDLGFGIGWREGDWLFMATVDFFSIRQPRQYFIDQYKDQNKPYIINGQTQTSIDITDNSIFHNVIVPSFGIKMAYTFTLAKSFYSNSQQLTK